MTLDKAKMIAIDLMRYHGLENWQFEFDKDTEHIGSCQPTLNKITLDSNFIEGKREAPGLFYNETTEEGIIDIILHEIAHAIAPAHIKGNPNKSSMPFKSHGKRVDHGPAWRFTAISIGCGHAICYPSEEEIPGY